MQVVRKKPVTSQVFVPFGIVEDSNGHALDWAYRVKLKQMREDHKGEPWNRLVIDTVEVVIHAHMSGDSDE